MMRTEGGSRPAARARKAPAWFRDSNLSVAVVVLATTFNAILAAMNAHAVHLNSIAVIGCEAVITALAAVLGLNGRLPVKQVWLALVGILIVLGLGTGLASGQVDPKFVRDVLLIPIFVLLGLSCRRSDAIRAVIVLQWIVFAFLMMEAVTPTAYAKLFDIMGYYINTRSFQQKQFWNSGSDLFVSATRPGERFIGGLDIHRLSSIFLEPVSLGNYCVIIAMVILALWSSFSLFQRVFLVATNTAVLVGSDGRFAAVTILLIVGTKFLTPLLPRFSAWFYLPGVVSVAALAVYLLSIPPGGDDFRGRMAGSIDLLSQLGGVNLMGFTTGLAYNAMDSGIAYLVISQSLAGTILLWSWIALGLPQEDKPATTMVHATCLYVALLLLISYSLFSIKTAALLWFCCGAIARPSDSARAPTRAEWRAEHGARALA